MLINIPIESLEERYSAQWNEWFPQAFQEHNIDFLTVYPTDHAYERIQSGEFLDVVGTNVFKLAQLQELIGMVKSGVITDQTVLFFHDLWFPGLEALFYIRDALGLKFKITGCLHAGTWDDWDFLTQRGMTKWARNIEIGWLKAINLIFVATDYHRHLIQTKRNLDAKIVVTGFPIKPLPFDPDKKENIVVFPHRLAPEKWPDEFDRATEALRDQFPDWRFVKSKEVTSTKAEYYTLLAKSKIAVSTAKQETWGIAQQEATLSGCIPIVPTRLSYKEMYYNTYWYSPDKLPAALRHFINTADEELASKTLASQRHLLITKGNEAIPNMLTEIRKRNWM